MPSRDRNGALRCTVLLLAASFFARAGDGRAILECTADATAQIHRGRASLIESRSMESRIGGADQALLLEFRIGVVAGWRVRKATLLLHLAGGLPPAQIEVATARAPWSELRIEAANGRVFDARRAAVAILEQGWLSVDVPPALVQALADRRAFGLLLREPAAARTRRFHARESRQFAPYLVVEGLPQ